MKFFFVTTKRKSGILPKFIQNKTKKDFLQCNDKNSAISCKDFLSSLEYFYSRVDQFVWNTGELKFWLNIHWKIFVYKVKYKWKNKFHIRIVIYKCFYFSLYIFNNLKDTRCNKFPNWKLKRLLHFHSRKVRYQDINLSDNIMAAKNVFRAKSDETEKNGFGIWKLMDVLKQYFWFYCCFGR